MVAVLHAYLTARECYVVKVIIVTRRKAHAQPLALAIPLHAPFPFKRIGRPAH